MTLHYKIDGVWTTVNRPYVKRNDVWTPVQQAYVKRSGVWTQAFEWDVTPPNSPEISLQIIEPSAGAQHIRVGIRMPSGIHDASLRRIRVLTNYPPPLGAMPTTYLGGTYTAGGDSSYPNEPWSEWRYNSFGGSNYHPDSSVYQYKEWPRNASSSTALAPGTYCFAAWAEDINGNWSPGTFNQIVVPKLTVDASNVIQKQKRVQANASGSITTDGYVDGVLTQRDTPASYGMWFHGSEFIDSVGSQGTPTISSAQIYIRRENDNGAASANIYLFWHQIHAPGFLGGPPISVPKFEAVKIGTLAKGEGKWFPIPSNMWNDFNSNIKGFGLLQKDPIKASAFAEDYSVINGIDTSLRCGEVHLVWSEKP